MFAMMRGDALPPGQTRLGRCATVARFAWNTGPWTRDDTFLCSDPRPAWVDFRQMLKRLGGETFDIIGNPDTADSRS
jgi:hypothetical protein